MSSVREYDAVVIGAGQGGMPLARTMAAAGRKTAIIERKHVGGTCINTGCTPTKTMAAGARVAYLARRAADYGIDTGRVTTDMARVRERKRAIVRDFRAGNEQRIHDAENLDLIRGEASFTGPRTLEVTLQAEEDRLALQADLVFIDTGSRPSQPPIPGLEEVLFFDSTSIMEVGEVPRHLVVLGGGYVGVEFSQMFVRYGAEVTLIQRGNRLLAQEDDDISDEVADILREDGIDVVLNGEATEARGNGQTVELEVNAGGEERVFSASHLLVAAGRTPNIEALDLEAGGVEIDEGGFILTNDRLEASAEGVYAIGDVKGGAAFTHVSYDDYRIISSNLLEGKEASVHDRLLPYTVFIDPQLGRVGMTEREARERGRDARIAKIPMTWVARALEMDESRGMMKAVVDAETDRILGAAVLGVDGGEIAAQIQIAMMGDLPYTRLRDGMFTHPTLAESMNTLFASFAD